MSSQLASVGVSSQFLADVCMADSATMRIASDGSFCEQTTMPRGCIHRFRSGEWVYDTKKNYGCIASH